jgi:hypothetical protein
MTASFEPRSPHLTFLDHTHTHTHTQIDESEILISLLQRQTHEMNIHALSRIQTHDASN